MTLPKVKVNVPEIKEDFDANKFLPIQDTQNNYCMISCEIDRALVVIKEERNIDCEEIHQYVSDLRSLLSQFTCKYY